MNNDFEMEQGGGFYATPSPAELELKKLRSDSFKIGIAVICVYFIINAWAYIFYGIMGIFGFSLNETYALITDEIFLQGVEIFLSSLMFFVPFIICATHGANRVNIGKMFKFPAKEKVLPYLLLGVGTCVFANLTDGYVSSYLERMGFSYDAGLGNYPKGVLGFVLSVISTAVVPAIMEEFAFRGVVYGLLEKFGKGFAIVCSGVLFGIIHGNFDQMFFALMVGLVLGFIRAKTDSVWICMIVHGINNLIAVLFDYIPSGIGVELLAIINILYYLIALSLAVFAIIKISYQKQEFSLKEKVCENRKTVLYKTFWLNPAIIFAVALFMYQAISYFF